MQLYFVVLRIICIMAHARGHHLGINRRTRAKWPVTHFIITDLTINFVIEITLFRVQ